MFVLTQYTQQEGDGHSPLERGKTKRKMDRDCDIELFAHLLHTTKQVQDPNIFLEQVVSRASVPVPLPQQFTKRTGESTILPPRLLMKLPSVCGNDLKDQIRCYNLKVLNLTLHLTFEENMKCRNDFL